MKPNFALTLSFDRIGLLHRTQGGWHLVGDVALDSATMSSDLGDLAAKARTLEPKGMRCKLVLPPEQIKYLAFDSATTESATIEHEVRNALDGATPYALDDLCYDWSLRERRVHVAAVARETLEEAEAFAAERAFNPVCFVAMPEAEDFAGEPFFGETAQARNLLGPGETVEREQAVICINGAARLPDPAPVAEAAAASDAAASDAAASDAATPAAQSPEPPNGPAPVALEKHPATDAGKTRNKRRRKAGAGPDSELETTPPAFTSIRAAGWRGKAAVPPPQEPSQRPPLPEARFSPPPLSATAQPSRADPPAPEVSPAKAAATLDEAERLTIFGARQTAEERPDRQRYLALTLTVLLLLVLVILAVWASLATDNRLSRLIFGPPEGAEVAAEPAATVTAPATPSATPAAPDGKPPKTPGQGNTPADKPGPDTVTATAVTTPPDVARPDTTHEAEAGAETAPPAEPEPSVAITRLEIIPETLTPEEARRRYAATGIWQIAPEPSTPPEVTTRRQPYQPPPDAPVNIGELAALSGAEVFAYQVHPPRPANPPPPLMRFELDARGFIAASPEGTETPDGVMLYAGPPPVIPPPTPPRAAPRVLDDPAAAAPAEPRERPRPRPEDLTGMADGMALQERARAADGRLRPKLRPRSAQELAADTAGTGGAIDPAAPLAGATEQAVSVSLAPRARPARLAAIVERARASASAAPVSTDQRMAATDPTAATVARAATEKNEIALRGISLIGVYGSPDNRRALVRLANGRYRKVEVGDKIDAGQVVAIGGDQLRYVRRGRTLVLKMPQG